jgi:Fur family ferric uptake transcriptional regulator
MAAIVRNTRQRAAIRKVLEESGYPMLPEEILAAAQRLVQGLGIATVYRNINTLVEERWLTPVDLPGQSSRYELASKGHHHHFCCTNCGRIFDLPGCVEGGVRRMVPRGFHITHHDILLSGFCDTCRRAKQKSLSAHN